MDEVEAATQAGLRGEHIEVSSSSRRVARKKMNAAVTLFLALDEIVISSRELDTVTKVEIKAIGEKRGSIRFAYPEGIF